MSMATRVLFFGATADIAGTRATEMNTLNGMTAFDALAVITSQYPLLSKHKLHISINQEFAAEKQTIVDGDEIAIFTAVSGG